MATRIPAGWTCFSSCNFVFMGGDRRFVPYFDAATGPTGAVVYWHVDDVQATLGRLLSLGARQLEAPQDRGHGFVTASVIDPFGNILAIMYNPHYVAILDQFQTA